MDRPHPVRLPYSMDGKGTEKRRAYLIIGSIATLLFLLFGIIGNGPSTYRFAILFLGPLLWAAYFLRHRLFIHPAGFALFAAALLMHDLGAFGAYQKVFFGVQFDTVVHFFFGFVVAVLLARALRFGFTLSGWQLWIATILVMLGLSAVHELIEYASTLLLGPEKGMLKINDPDKFDTQKDLLNNLLGTCLALFLSQCARRFQPRKSSSQASPIPSPDAE